MKDYGEMPLTDAEFEALIEAEPFSSGTTRQVYNVPSDPDVVVKKTINDFPGPNIIERFIWNALRDTSLEDLFGRCVTVSWSGRYLMMERLSDTGEDDVFPDIPDWLTDRKRSAFGKDRDGVIKVRDYAGTKIGFVLEADRRIKVDF
jgi:hypothetical protein